MLDISQVRKTFGGDRVLRDVSLSIRDGEFFSLLGASGCGKTTLLRIIAGFETPDAGDLTLDNASFRDQPAHKRPFNIVFQRYALFPHLTVRGNVAFGLEVKGVPKAEVSQRVDEALALVALEGFESRRVLTLSGGQQQRVALARALVGRPRVLLLDEPLSALDLKLRQKMQTELRALQRRLGMTFLFVTHAQDEALTLSDRVAVMRGGEIEQIGNPADLYERPATPFVAHFVGANNRAAVRLARVMGDSAEAEVGGMRVTARQVGLTATSDAAELLVRPERVRLQERDRGGLSGTVRQIFYKGPFLDVEVYLDAVPAVPWTVTLSNGTSPPALGARVSVGFATNDALLVRVGAES